jgi:NAD(P)H-dependent flavin oxidoreductase YrpB (nitropropane dioxygenase family)
LVAQTLPCVDVAAALDLRDLETPIVQAGMGSISRHELAAAVSDAGGLGTIAGAGAPIAEELAAARALTGRPIAVNLLLPFVRRGDAEAAAAADAIITFWGEPRRPARGVWIHQCGSLAEAKAAEAEGADAVIAQGVEAGGHVRGRTPLLELVAQVRAAVRIPVLAAGGIVDADGVRAALDAGAVAAVVGTRFLLSEESRAHPEYKRRCLEAEETVLTELFGLGWPDAPHRVVPNAATRRWLGEDQRGPGWIRVVNRVTGPVARTLPAALQQRAAVAQRAGRPLLSPRPPTDDGPDTLVDSGPLYAGANVTRVAEIRPAAELVRALTP